VGGFVLAVGLIAVTTAGTVGVRYTGLGWRTAILLAGGALAVGNILALLRQFVR